MTQLNMAVRHSDMKVSVVVILLYLTDDLQSPCCHGNLTQPPYGASIRQLITHSCSLLLASVVFIIGKALQVHTRGHSIIETWDAVIIYHM